MKQTRTVLLGMPRMLGGIIRELVSAEPDLTIVGELEDGDRALETVERSRAHVVITGVDTLVPGQVSRLLSTPPRVRVLTVSADGGESVLYELRPQERRLGEISPETLLAAIRGRLDDEPTERSVANNSAATTNSPRGEGRRE